MDPCGALRRLADGSTPRYRPEPDGDPFKPGALDVQTPPPWSVLAGLAIRVSIPLLLTPTND